MLIATLATFIVDSYCLIIICWVYSLRWDRTGISSVAIITLSALGISLTLWYHIIYQAGLRILRVYYHLRGVRVSDHKKKKAIIHKPKSSQVVPLKSSSISSIPQQTSLVENT